MKRRPTTEIITTSRSHSIGIGESRTYTGRGYEAETSDFHHDEGPEGTHRRVAETDFALAMRMADTLFREVSYPELVALRVQLDSELARRRRRLGVIP